MPQQRPLGVGLIGTGFMGKCHAIAWSSAPPIFGDLPPIRLAALAEVNEDLAQRKAAEFGFERFVVSLKDSDPSKVVAANRRFSCEPQGEARHTRIPSTGS